MTKDVRLKWMATAAALSLPTAILPVLWMPLVVVPLGCVTTVVTIVLMEIWSA